MCWKLQKRLVNGNNFKSYFTANFPIYFSVLEANPDEKETRNWELKLSEAFYNLGQIMLLSDQPQDAKKEFFSSLDIKKKYLDSTDRELASVYFDLAKAFESCNEFSDAKAQYGTALESLSKKIG